MVCQKILIFIFACVCDCVSAARVARSNIAYGFDFLRAYYWMVWVVFFLFWEKCF